MKNLLALIVCVSSTSFLACGSEDDGDDEQSGNVDCSGDLPTYDSFGEEFVDTYCLGCHGEGIEGAPDNTFGSLEDIQDQAGDMARELTNRTMPPQGAKQPSAAERDEAIQWLSCNPE